MPIEQSPSEKLDPLYSLTRTAIIETQSASAASLQRRLKVGYNRAQELLSLFEGELVSPVGPDGCRSLLPQLLDITHANHPTNTYWVVPGCLMAGEYPGTRDSGTTRHRLDQLLAFGITGFLDLTEAGELRAYDNELKESALAQKLDCAYRRMPIQDFNIPSDPQHMVAILQQIDDWMREQRTVYVHCWGGVGRTGTVVGCYLVQNGMTGQAALNQIRLLWTRMSADKQKRRPVSPETAAQCGYVRAWSTHTDKQET